MIGMTSEVKTQEDEDCNGIGDPSGVTIEGWADQYLYLKYELQVIL